MKKKGDKKTTLAGEGGYIEEGDMVEGELPHVTVWIDKQEISSEGMSVGGKKDVVGKVEDLSPPYVVTVERLGGCGYDVEWDEVFYGGKKLVLAYDQIRGEDFEYWTDADSERADPKSLDDCNSRVFMTFMAE